MAEPLTSRLPNAQVTVLPATAQLPWLDEAEMEAMPPENALVRLTPVDAEGPPLATVIENVRLLFRGAGFDDGTLVTAKSATGTTVTA